MERDAAEWIAGGFTLERARATVEARILRTAQAPTPAGYVDLSEREATQYSLPRAILSVADGTWNRGGLEKEASDAIAKKLGASGRGGFYMPMNLKVQTRAAVTGNIVATASLGGNAVETTLVGFIELLRARMAVTRLGATVLNGLTGNVAIPRQITANTLNWVGENPSSANTLGSLTLDQVTLSPKVAMVSTAYSRLSLIQTSPDIGNMLANDLVTLCAQGLDTAAIVAGGGSAPVGILGISGTTARAIGTDGGPLTWAHVVGYETDIATANADQGSLGFLTTPGVRGKARVTLQNTVAGANYLWGAGDRLNGYQAEVSNNVPATLTKGTSTTICHAAIFGKWDELLLGLWGGACELLVDPYSYAGQNMIAMHCFMNADVDVRHPAAFVATEDLTIT
jgi:HK97 family phage major capsid protein